MLVPYLVMQIKLTRTAGDLCQKGYQRHNEYETHIGSYDHQHKKESKEPN